ncbi:MAG TPA: hypothetical protein VJ553_04270, partial [Candidatus Paceibacterota bacterium]|nr:hypothetical protein [Candidatus Paceibacterota bacterium]
VSGIGSADNSRETADEVPTAPPKGATGNRSDATIATAIAAQTDRVKWHPSSNLEWSYLDKMLSEE